MDEKERFCTRLQAVDVMINGFELLRAEIEFERPSDPREQVKRELQLDFVGSSLDWLRDEREATRNTIEYLTTEEGE